MLNTFWKESSKRKTDEQRGRTESEISEYEKQIGFTLPTSFKELYKIQNGGRLKKGSYDNNGKLMEFFGDSIQLDPMQKLPHDFLNMKNYIIAEWGEDDEDIETLSDTEFNYLERLIFVSHLHGHAWMLFDYGWKEKEILKEPNVLFLRDDFTESLRIKDFDTFLKGLKYYGYEFNEYFFGLSSEKKLEAIISEISNQLSVPFEKKSTFREFRFHFSEWYTGNMILKDKSKIVFNFSPNQFLSSRYLFPQKQNVNCIIGILLYDEKGMPRINNSNKHLKMIKEMFSKLEFKDEIENLLIPENVEK